MENFHAYHFLVPLFMFTTSKETFSKNTLFIKWQKTLIPLFYIYNNYLNKQIKFCLCFRIIRFQI